MDLIAWAMETKRAIYMIWTDNCSVDVFEPFKYPYNINLEDASPSKEDTVMELRNEHFNSLVPQSNLCDVESCLSKLRGTSGKCTKHGGGSRCEVADCNKLAREKSMRCGEHGGGSRCEVASCEKMVRGNSMRCQKHGGKSKTKANYRLEPRVIGTANPDAVNKAVDALTGDAASRGLRPTGHITSISDDVKARIQREIDLFDEEKKHRRSICACCDELCKNVHEIHINEEWVERLKRRLPWMAGVPTSLRDQYNVAKVDSRLSSLASVPLSPRGVIRGDASSKSRLAFCVSCHRSLCQSSQRTPPKFAIANGWEIGDPPPCLTEATWAEVKMISLASVSANIKVIGRGGGRKKLHSHTMAFINAPGPAITYLPRSIEKEDLQVVFSNATAKDMDFAKKKFVRVRRNQIDQMAAFVKENNPAYARATRLQTDIDSLEEDSILVDHCAEDNRDLITEVINDASRVNTDVDDTSTSLMETSGGLFNLTPEPPPPLPDDDETNADEEKGSSPMRKFQVRRSNALLGSRDAEFYGAAFPELFAYGRGTPNSTRPVAVSLEAGLRHLLMLSNRVLLFRILN